MLGPVRLLAADVLAPIDGDRWRSGPIGRPGDRVLGSQVLCQATLVAGRVDGRVPYSLHAHFLAGGDSGVALDYAVTVLRSGRSSGAVRVDAVQGDTVLATATISTGAAASPDGGHDWQVSAPDLGRPAEVGPHGVMTSEFLAEFDRRADHLDMHPTWIRHRGPFPDDPLAHAATLAFFSDIGVTYSAHPPVVRRRDRLGALSLDHALWWHRPARVTDWLVVTADPVCATGRRGVAHGAFHDEAGVRVASFSQVVLLTR